MIVDDFRKGKQVELELASNGKIKCARVDLNVVSVLAEPPSNNTVRSEMSGEARESTNLSRAGQQEQDSRGGVQKLNGKRDHNHIDLGLAILSSKEYEKPIGSTRTLEEIAAFCGCSRQRIEQIEKRALRKLRIHMKHHEKDLETK